MRKLTLILAGIGSLMIVGVSSTWLEIRCARRHAESAVAATLERIRQMDASGKPNTNLITSAAVGRASVQVLSTNPLTFQINAVTPWPDVMIYKYDPNTSEKGVYHYPF